jgi:hypothetical protein
MRGCHNAASGAAHRVIVSLDIVSLDHGSSAWFGCISPGSLGRLAARTDKQFCARGEFRAWRAKPYGRKVANALQMPRSVIQRWGRFDSETFMAVGLRFSSPLMYSTGCAIAWMQCPNSDVRQQRVNILPGKRADREAPFW